MDSTPCGHAERSKTQELLCQECALEKAQFRIRKDKRYVRDVESDQKEREYIVVSRERMRTDLKVASDVG
jgi:hypothetical protein